MLFVTIGVATRRKEIVFNRNALRNVWVVFLLCRASMIKAQWCCWLMAEYIPGSIRQVCQMDCASIKSREAVNWLVCCNPTVAQERKLRCVPASIQPKRTSWCLSFLNRMLTSTNPTEIPTDKAHSANLNALLFFWSPIFKQRFQCTPICATQCKVHAPQRTFLHCAMRCHEMVQVHDLKAKGHGIEIPHLDTRRLEYKKMFCYGRWLCGFVKTKLWILRFPQIYGLCRALSAQNFGVHFCTVAIKHFSREVVVCVLSIFLSN